MSTISMGIVAFGALHAAHATALKGTQAFQRGKYEEALKYLKPVADAGAMHVLGRIYTSGRGIEKDEKLATDYFLKVAALGNTAAQQSLGSALMLGEGIEQDMVEALKWFIISARAENKDAMAYTKWVGGLLSRDMQREARMKAVKWKQSHDKKTAAEGN